MSETFTIRHLGHRGDGVADGPVYAARTLPGEVVRGQRVGDRLADLRIETPSDHRVRPPCVHYRNCGGCQLQHAADGFVAEWKAAQVHAALAAHGLEARIAAIETSPSATRRRAGFAIRRMKSGVVVGFHARASNVVVPVPECRVLTPGLIAAIPALEALGAVLCSRKGELTALVTDSEAGPDVALSGGKPPDRTQIAELAAMAGQLGLSRLTCEGEPVAEPRPPVHRMGLARVVPPPGAFLQATAHGEAVLQRAVAGIVAGRRRIVDLFAGCGTFALPLAADAEVHAVEGDRAMCVALDRGWRAAPGLRRVTTEARDLFRRPLEPDDLKGYDAAVIDPPRAGAAAQIACLGKARLPVIAHVSCNPATFARDAATLVQAGYAMGPITVVDQFRWSTHVELVAAFTLA